MTIEEILALLDAEAKEWRDSMNSLEGAAAYDSEHFEGALRAISDIRDKVLERMA